MTMTERVTREKGIASAVDVAASAFEALPDDEARAEALRRIESIVGQPPLEGAMRGIPAHGEPALRASYESANEAILAVLRANPGGLLTPDVARIVYGAGAAPEKVRQQLHRLEGRGMVKKAGSESGATLWALA
jgi:hypothetical protein